MDALATPCTSRKVRKVPKIKGCHECARRRIDCDRQQPTCQKCRNKGLTCSGLGIKYRFSDNFATRGKLVGKPVPDILSYKNTRRIGARHPSLNAHIEDPESKVWSIDSNVHAGREAGDTCPSWIDQNLDHLDGRSRWHLQYFAENIAPVTAVIALGFNGYRDVVLPTAEHDVLVRKACVAVAEEHLAMQYETTIRSTQQMYGSLISDLIQRSKHFSPDTDESTMTTLLLLHLREMISGSGDFKLLFGPLRAVVRSIAPRMNEPRSRLTEFVQIQLLRVCLFGEALFDETHGAKFLTTYGEDCLEFLRYCQMFHPEFEQLMSYLFQMFQLACSLYIQRATFDPLPHETVCQVDHFISLTEQVDMYDSTVGRHLLVWSYFIVAAESSTVEHRSYFLNKLKVLHLKTRCGSILRAVDQLQSIWATRSTTRWTSLLGGPTQTLIM